MNVRTEELNRLGWDSKTHTLIKPLNFLMNTDITTLIRASIAVIEKETNQIYLQRFL